jgi:hypothetical protein
MNTEKISDNTLKVTNSVEVEYSRELVENNIKDLTSIRTIQIARMDTDLKVWTDILAEMDRLGIKIEAKPVEKEIVTPTDTK